MVENCKYDKEQHNGRCSKKTNHNNGWTTGLWKGSSTACPLFHFIPLSRFSVNSGCRISFVPRRVRVMRGGGVVWWQQRTKLLC